MKWSRSLSAKFFAPLALVIVLLAPAAQAAPIRRVAVEIGFYGNSAIAAHIRQALPRHLSKELAKVPLDQYPAGARLVVRVTDLLLSSDAFPRERFGGMSSSDGVDGEAMIVDGRGRVIVSKRVAGRSSPSSAGFAPAPYNEPRRVEALMEAFAYWIVREFR
jgi:hypothetical protein